MSTHGPLPDEEPGDQQDALTTILPRINLAPAPSGHSDPAAHPEIWGEPQDDPHVVPIRQLRAVIIKDGRMILMRRIGGTHYFLPGARIREHESRRAGLAHALGRLLGVSVRSERLIIELENSFERDGVLYEETVYLYEVTIGAKQPECQRSDLEVDAVLISRLRDYALRPDYLFDILEREGLLRLG